MNNLFAYLVELNISLMILFVAYKLFFEKDKNFIVRGTHYHQPGGSYGHRFRLCHG